MKARSSDPRTEIAIGKLLVSAEWLFASRGIDATSLREVAVHAGSKNNNVVQYHFGSKERLLKAVFDLRAGQMEERRGAMIAAALREKRFADPGLLLEIICLPHLDLKDVAGKHPYAHFLVHYATRAWKADTGNDWTHADEIAPNLYRVIAALAEALQPLPDKVARSRIQLCVFMFLNALMRLDYLEADPATARTLLHDALHAAKGALTAGSVSQDAPLFHSWFPGLN